MKNFNRRISILQRDQGLMDVPAPSTVTLLTEVERISRLALDRLLNRSLWPKAKQTGAGFPA